MRRVPTGALAAAALALASCGSLGPYPDVGQKLDLALRITGGETWIAARPTGGTAATNGCPADEPEIRILVLGKDSDGLPTQFAYSALCVPNGAGISSRMMQGLWTEHAGTMILTEQTEYTLANERSKSLGERFGARRVDDLNTAYKLAVTRTADRLVVDGDPAIDGTYVPSASALGHLGSATQDDAACAYYVANLAVMTAQVRILGFGGPLMLQYRSPESFEGTLSGNVHVAMSGSLMSPDVDITFDGYSDFGGVQLDGTQRTHTDADGNGTTQDTVRFRFQPGTTAPPLTGSVLYDLVITNGFASGGHYDIAVDGGASGTTDPVSPPQPPVATCLGLP